MFNVDSEHLKKDGVTVKGRCSQGKKKSNKRLYDFMFVPNCGFLNSNLPLLNDCEVRLSFDRVNSDIALMTNDEAITNDISGKPITIHDCYAVTEYISSDYYRNKFSRIDMSLMKYMFEECDVTLKSIPMQETDIRLDNIRGGNSPNCIFVGVIETGALNGNMKKSSVGFQHNNVNYIDITFNGKSVNGYPIEIEDESPVLPLQKYYDTTNRFMNPLASGSITMNAFKHNWLYAHKFEAEMSTQGWLGVKLKLSEAFTTSHTLVIWSVHTSAITIDKFHQIEKLIL